jgi:xanthine dehydrogenase accessory factor
MWGHDLNDIALTTLSLPVRASTLDNPADVLGFAAEAVGCGGAALATLVEIRGGAARALGSHVSVAADGRYCGYVSGGCVEAAVAAEALQAIAEGRDRLVKFGEGSPFFDIVLPCGGGISVAIHVLRDENILREALSHLIDRQAVGLSYEPKSQTLMRSGKSGGGSRGRLPFSKGVRLRGRTGRSLQIGCRAGTRHDRCLHRCRPAAS